jgi:hypothetical protein
MPAQFAKYCRALGCRERHRNAGAFCDKHLDVVRNAAWKRQTERRKHDPLWRLYNSSPWPRFKAAFAAAGNVVCQAIIDGKQCTRPVEIHHHIRPPETHPQLFYSWSNVVGVCRQHHPNTPGNSPEELQRIHEIYVPTKLPSWMKEEIKW